MDNKKKIIAINNLVEIMKKKLQNWSLLEKAALQYFTSQVNSIKGVPICKDTFVLALQKVKCKDYLYRHLNSIRSNISPLIS